MSNDPDTLPTLGDPTGPCPRCARVSNFFTPHSQPLVTARPKFETGGDERLVVLTCMACRSGTLVVETLTQDEDSATHTWVGSHWWPVPGAGSLDPAVPVAVASAYDEGARCVAVRADHAAVVMFRAALAEIVTDQGSAKAQSNRGLATQLKQMAEDGDLHPSLVEWAAEIRLLGDVGAHPNELGAVDHAGATDLSHLTRRVIELVYEMPARIDRSRQSRATTP